MTVSDRVNFIADPIPFANRGTEETGLTEDILFVSSCFSGRCADCAWRLIKFCRIAIVIDGCLSLNSTSKRSAFVFTVCPRIILQLAE